MFMTKYESPVGNLTLVSNGRQLTGLFVDGQRYFPDLSKIETKKDLAVFDATIHWLDAYFEGKSPCGETIPLKPEGTTFRMAVWKLLKAIPYGETTTYGELARRLNETAGMGSRAGDPAFMGQFENRSVTQFVHNKGGASGDNTIDAISGASTTSGAVVNAVNAGLDFFHSVTGGGK